MENADYPQAPPFLESIIRAVESHLSEEEQTDFAATAEWDSSDEGEQLLALEDAVGSVWYTTHFLSPEAWSKEDEELLASAFKKNAHLENFEVARFDYEREVNQNNLLLENLVQIGESGTSLARRLPKPLGLDKTVLGNLIALLPRGGQLDLTNGLPPGITKSVIYRLLRWIEALPPFHREIFSGVTIICGKSDCEFTPTRIPGIGFQFHNRQIFVEEGVASSVIRVAPDTVVQMRILGKLPQKSPEFRVHTNGKLGQSGMSPKIDVNFACKLLRISSEKSSLEITRSVKSLDLPFGAIEFSFSESSKALRLEDQLSRAWWFEDHQTLITVMQSDQVYLVQQDRLQRIGHLPFSNYGIDCSINNEMSLIAISSLGPEILFIDVRNEEAHLKDLQPIPHELWTAISDLQYSGQEFEFLNVEPIPLPESIAKVPLSHLRWFDYKPEMALLKIGIETAGDLLHEERGLLQERVKFRERDFEDIQPLIANLLLDKWHGTLDGETQLGVWEGIRRRGWVGPIPDNDKYDAPKVVDESLLRRVNLENRILGVEFDDDFLEIELDLGLVMRLDAEMQVESLQVIPWSPNRFVQRIYNQSLEMDD